MHPNANPGGLVPPGSMGLLLGPVSSGMREGRFPSLGFDPAPGDIQSGSDAVASLDTVSQKLHAAHMALRGVSYSDGVWRGEGADAFRSRVGELPAKLETASNSLRDAKVALDGWVSDLGSFQREANGLEDEAVAARTAIARAESHPGWSEQGRTYSDPHALAAAQGRLNNAEATLRRTTGELEDIIERAKSLLRRHTELAEAIAQKLRAAADQAPDKGFLDYLGDIVDIHKQQWEDFKQFIRDNSEIITKVANISSTVSSVLATAAAISAATGIGAPFAGALGATAAVLSGVALIGHTAVAATSDDPLSAANVKTIAGDVAAAIPMASPLKSLIQVAIHI